MMKAKYIAILLACACGCARAQMPAAQPQTAAPTGFDASGSSVKPASNDPAHRGETPNPQLFGMEIPLMDPSSDTASYNGGVFDVGNNALVRARFEKYLQQVPDDSNESKRYREIINQILKQTQRSGRSANYKLGSEALINIGRGLYEADKYPGDGGQSGTLASAIVSALDVQRKNMRRDQQSEKLEAELDELVIKADNRQNSNVRRKDAINKNNQMGGRKGGSAAGDVYALRVAHEMKKVGKNEATVAANTTANEADLAMAKVNYQSLLLTLLLSRRFDHAVIGSRVYRHVFKDGDTRVKLQKDSKADQVFSGGAGMPPTVNSIDSLAGNARRDVDQSIAAVYSMLAQNKLAEATQHLIEAVAIGEFMQSVATFPTEGRQRIARYWTLRKRALTALNARDYATVEEVAAKMKEMDVDFDDSMLLSYTTGKKRQSDLAIRNAAKALRAGDEEAFNNYIQEAGTIWPRNPRLEEGIDLITKIDEGDPVKEEFRNLYAQKEFRRIAKDKERFKIVAMDSELAKQYEEVITLVMRMDEMLEQIRAMAAQGGSLGACMAYEKVVEWQKKDENFAEDLQMKDALRDFETQAYEFVKALRDGEACEARREFGSALSCYYRAQCKYPQSTIAAEGIRRVTDVIVKASYE